MIESGLIYNVDNAATGPEETRDCVSQMTDGIVLIHHYR